MTRQAQSGMAIRSVAGAERARGAARPRSAAAPKISRLAGNQEFLRLLRSPEPRRTSRIPQTQDKSEPATEAAGRSAVASAYGLADPANGLALSAAGARVQRKCAECEQEEREVVQRLPGSSLELAAKKAPAPLNVQNGAEQAGPGRAHPAEIRASRFDSGGGCACRRKETAEPEIQPKLTVGPANDRHEQEADRVADQVVRMPDTTAASASNLNPAAPGAAQAKPAITPLAQSRRIEAGEEEPKREGRESELPRSSIDRHMSALRGAGSPMLAETQSFFEQRFGYSFGDVRIHTGARADRAARSIQAKAFTTGTDIVFRHGAYRPGDLEGRRLLAHELTHVVQQRGPAATKAIVRRAPAGGSSPLVCEDKSESSGAGNVTTLGPTSWSFWNFDIDEHGLKREHLSRIKGDIGAELLAALADPATVGTVLILGSTSATASTPHNLALSDRRATCVADALLTVGIPRDRIAGVAGFGDISAETRLRLKRERGETVTSADRENPRDRQVTILVADIEDPEKKEDEPDDCRAVRTNRYVAWFVRGALSAQDILEKVVKRLPKGLRKKLEDMGKKVKDWLGPLGDLVPWNEIDAGVGAGYLEIGTSLTDAEKKAGKKDIKRRFVFESIKLGSDAAIDGAKTPKPVTLTTARRLQDLNTSTMTLELKAGSNDQTLSIADFGSLEMKGVQCNKSGGTAAGLVHAVSDTICEKLKLPPTFHRDCKEDDEEEVDGCDPVLHPFMPSSKFNFRVGRMSMAEVDSDASLQPLRFAKGCNVAAARVWVETKLLDGTWIWRPFHWLQSTPECRFNVEKTNLSAVAPSFTRLADIGLGDAFPDRAALNDSTWTLTGDGGDLTLGLPGRWDGCPGGMNTTAGLLLAAGSTSCGRAKTPPHTPTKLGVCDRVAARFGPLSEPLLWLGAASAATVGPRYLELLTKDTSALVPGTIELGAVFGGLNWAGQLVLTIGDFRVLRRLSGGRVEVEFLDPPCSVNFWGQPVFSVEPPLANCTESVRGKAILHPRPRPKPAKPKTPGPVEGRASSA